MGVRPGNAVKYKHIPAMTHNFTHSFMSAENYVDGGYVFEELSQLARENPGRVISARAENRYLSCPESTDPHTGCGG